MDTQAIINHVKRHAEHQFTNMHGWCSVEKAIDITECVIETKSQLSVELGVFGGKSLLAFALAHEAIRTGKIIGIDPWMADACSEGHNDSKNDQWWTGMVNLNQIYHGFCGKMFQDYNVLLPYCNWLRLKSWDAARLFDDGTVDILHDDGNHSEELTCGNYHAWINKMKPLSMIIIDDINWPTLDKAVSLWKDAGYVERKNAVTYLILERSE
jgi:hypothetical protein